MFVTKHAVTITTAADGSGTGFTPVVNGRVLAVAYTKADGTAAFAAGVDLEIKTETTDTLIWDQDDVDASATVAPRQPTHSTAGVAALYAAEGTAVQDYIYVADERIEITIANGGDTKTGTFVVWVG